MNCNITKEALALLGGKCTSVLSSVRGALTNRHNTAKDQASYLAVSARLAEIKKDTTQSYKLRMASMLEVISGISQAVHFRPKSGPGIQHYCNMWAKHWAEHRHKEHPFFRFVSCPTLLPQCLRAGINLVSFGFVRALLANPARALVFSKHGLANITCTVHCGAAACGHFVGHSGPHANLASCLRFPRQGFLVHVY